MTKTVKVAVLCKSGRRIHCPAEKDERGNLKPVLPPGEELSKMPAIVEVEQEVK